MSLGEATATLELGEFRDLVRGFAHTFGTQTNASVNGWRWPMSLAEYATQLHALRYLNVTSAKDTPPVTWEWPWKPADAVSEKERARLMALLERSSAFNRPDD